MNIAATANARLNTRSGQLEDRFRNDIRTLVYAGDIPMDMPPEPVFATSLQQTGTPDDIFYYHTNHLGSTAFVTDANATVTQGFLYAPFGEITTEYAPMWQNGVLPNYTFNAKELDEETGMYYYEARYMAPPTFISRDPMFEQKPWLSPYHYCSNNPVGRVDPTGMLDGEPDDPPGGKTTAAPKIEINPVVQDNLKPESLSIPQSGNSSQKHYLKFRGDGIYGVAPNGQSEENRFGNGRARQVNLGDFTDDWPEAPTEKYKKQDMTFENPFVLSDNKRKTEPYGTEGYYTGNAKNDEYFVRYPYFGSSDSMKVLKTMKEEKLENIKPIVTSPFKYEKKINNN